MRHGASHDRYCATANCFHTVCKALAPTVIGIEACGASHHWARILRSFGHEVKLIAPQLVKPYVKRGKNDTADAEALCEAMSRPTMRFVPVKTAEQQAALMMVALRDRLIRNRTQLSNAIRGYAAEFGFTAARGMAHIDPLLDRIQADENVPVLARELFAAQAEEYAQLQAQIAEVDAKLMAWHKADECSRRLAKIPGVGPIGAALLMMKTPAPEMFRSGRQFAAWIGLTPKDHSTAGKVRLGVITRAGDEALRSVLVVGATAVVQHVRRGGRGSPWILHTLNRLRIAVFDEIDCFSRGCVHFVVSFFGLRSALFRHLAECTVVSVFLSMRYSFLRRLLLRIS